MKVPKIPKVLQNLPLTSYFPSKRKMLNIYYDTKQFVLEHWTHIIITIIVIYLLISLSATSVESFQNEKETNKEIILPLTYDKSTNRFTTTLTFYESNKKTPIRMELDISTPYTTVVEENVVYCVTPAGNLLNIPCSKKCHSIYGSKCSKSKYTVSNRLNIDRKRLQIIKKCTQGLVKSNLCGQKYDTNSTRWSKLYKTDPQIEMGDQIFHIPININIVNKLFSTSDKDQGWNTLGLGNPTNNNSSILQQLDIEMFTIYDNPDNPDNHQSKLIFQPSYKYFNEPDHQTQFSINPDGERYHIFNRLSLKTSDQTKLPKHIANLAHLNTNNSITKIFLKTTSSEIEVNHSLKVQLLEIFRITGLLTTEEDDNAFTHYNKPLVINYKPELMPILKFEFKYSPSKPSQQITLKPRNYIKSVHKARNKVTTHFIVKQSYNQNIIFGLPFFKYRAVTFNDRNSALFIKELDEKPIISHSQQPTHPSPHQTVDKPYTEPSKSKQLRKRIVRRKPIRINLNYNQQLSSQNRT